MSQILHIFQTILHEAVAFEELADEDLKTKATKKYPNIPKGSIVYVIQEDCYNQHGGPQIRVEWKDNLYLVSSNKVKKLNFMLI